MRKPGNKRVRNLNTAILEAYIVDIACVYVA